MKLRTWILVLGLLVGGYLPSFLDAQNVDLVKLRKEEAERRKKLKQKQEKPVQITDANLKQIAEKRNKPGFAESEAEKETAPETGETPQAEPASQSEAQPLVIAADAAVDSQSGESEARRTPEYWQQMKRGLEEKIVELENRIRDNESRLNLLHTQYLNQDLPLERQRLKSELDELQKSQELDRKNLEQLRRELEELHERARKAGVPPGWLR